VGCAVAGQLPVVVPGEIVGKRRARSPKHIKMVAVGIHSRRRRWVRELGQQRMAVVQKQKAANNQTCSRIFRQSHHSAPGPRYLPGWKRSRHSYGCTEFSGFHTKYRLRSKGVVKFTGSVVV